MQMVRKLPLWVVVAALTAFFFVFFCQKTLLSASDLGRHITNGRVIMESGKIFSTNLYSYTHPDYPAPNHHWLFGVLVYYLEMSVGFAGLTLLSAALYSGAAGVMIWYCGRTYGRWAAVLSAVIVLPLITERTEVRPEAFSLFFFSLELVLLLLWQQKKLSTWIVATLLFIISVLWVNIHIFFFLVFTLLAAFGVAALLNRNWQQFKQVIIFGAVAGAGTLCNPLFLEGALYPFRILEEYGYPIAENQTPFFYLQYHTRPFHYYLLASFILAVTAVGWLVLKTKQFWQQQATILFLFLLYLGFTCKLIRFSNFLGIILLLVFSLAIVQTKPWLKKITEQLQVKTIWLSLSSFVGFGLLALMLASGLFMPQFAGTGVGLYPGNQVAAQFFKSVPIQGPIFNNFDIGGYLIYHLYPDYQVFVDNRAEAYPAEFLAEYKQAQLDEGAWRTLDEQYHFNAIFFNRLENTEWGQTFLIMTIQRPEWVPIFVDQYSIIFVRDIPEHQEIIEQYRLPEEMFNVRPN